MSLGAAESCACFTLVGGHALRGAAYSPSLGLIG